MAATAPDRRGSTNEPLATSHSADAPRRMQAQMHAHGSCPPRLCRRARAEGQTVSAATDIAGIDIGETVPDSPSRRRSRAAGCWSHCRARSCGNTATRARYVRAAEVVPGGDANASTHSRRALGAAECTRQDGLVAVRRTTGSSACGWRLRGVGGHVPWVHCAVPAYAYDAVPAPDRSAAHEYHRQPPVHTRRASVSLPGQRRTLVEEPVREPGGGEKVPRSRIGVRVAGSGDARLDERGQVVRAAVAIGEVMRCRRCRQWSPIHPDSPVGSKGPIGFVRRAAVRNVQRQGAIRGSIPRWRRCRPTSAACSALTGMTAYFGLLDVGAAKEATPWWSLGRSRAVSTVVRQVAKIRVAA